MPIITASRRGRCQFTSCGANGRPGPRNLAQDAALALNYGQRHSFFWLSDYPAEPGSSMIFRLFSSSKTSSLRKQAARDPADMQSRIELAQRLEQEADDTPRFAADYGEPSAKQKYKAAL